MTATEYREAGFIELSANFNDAAISRAEADIRAAYLTPILSKKSDEVEAAYENEVLMNLTVLLLMQRTLIATRSGAKEKISAESARADRWDVLSQNSATSALYLELFAKSTEVNDWKKLIKDICGIYFRTNYLGL